MGKGHKHHKAQSGSGKPTQPSATTSIPRSSAAVGSSRPLVQRIGFQLAALLGLSAALGFTFNSANPIGVRFSDAPKPAAPMTSLTIFNLASTTSVAITAPQPTQHTTLQPLRQPVPMPPHPASSPNVAAHVSNQVIARMSSSLASNAAAASNSSAQMATNPAPIHWREAKPLIASGQALLLDVRLTALYDAGHIPDAISIPETLRNEEVDAFLKKVPTNMVLITYCASTSCSQSKRVADRLAVYHKWPTVKYMTGGYQEYQQEELARSQPQPPQP